MKRTVILIDGQNLFYTLKDIGLRESDIHWTNFFKELLDAGDELLRTYWFRPKELAVGYFTKPNVEKVVVKKNYPSHAQNYFADKTSLPPSVLDQIRIDTQSVLDWIKSEEDRFERIAHLYDQISMDFEDIEISKKGVVKINPFRQLYIGEKGLDVSLAVKMISLSTKNHCDKIILLSGDMDYLDAVSFVKDNMTKVSLVKIHKGVPPINKSVSRSLAISVDKVINIYESDIRSRMLKQAPTP